ncbi:MAG: two-component system, OmpR family, sensor histidine kinase VicK [Patescibacteria group bacterium]|nr:two-component system, OmpR family, sensor histidine kinase VicK [Patescibacteria group bacterium]
MAEPFNKPLMRDYWAKYRWRTYVIITTAQAATMFVIIGVMELFGIVHVGWIGLLIATLLASLALNLVTVTLVHIIGRPFRDLVQAIVLVAGEPTSASPPNPNHYEYDNDGFKEILQTVYELAARETKIEQPPAPTLDATVQAGLANMNTGIVFMDGDMNITYYNEAAPVQPDTDGKPALAVYFPEDDTLEKWLTKTVQNKLTADHQWTRVADRLPGEKDRRIFDIAASYSKKSSAETVIVFLNRTHDYMPEEDDLDFISFAAHELRGPITVIRGYLDVLADELQPVLHNDQSELMERLIVASNRLNSYINNILNAARYDRRHLKLHLSEENVQQIYDQIADDMQMRASTQNRVLVTDIPPTLPTVAADANSIGEVIGNLIDNAIKYSNEGGLIHVVARPTPGFVEVSVTDRGIGMPNNVIANLFHKFYRSHRSRETVAGTGIGLYICKAIVSSHGGSITARSVENEGSTFSFTIPIYDTVADKIKAGNNSNLALIEHGSGWIKNHSMYRG